MEGKLSFKAVFRIPQSENLVDRDMLNPEILLPVCGEQVQPSSPQVPVEAQKGP
jgi:hypothetical protein